jgi:UPF0755 protein
MSIGRLLPVILAATLAAGALGYHAYREAEAPFRGFAGDEIFIPVTAGEPSRAIARSLQDSGVIKDAGLFLVLLKLRGKAGGLQAGEYRFTEPASLLEVMDRLVAGDVYYRSVTIPEGLTLWETADLLSQRGLGDGAALRAAFGRGALVASLDPRAGDLEGYLFPETYRFVRNPTPDEVAAALVDRFVSVFDDRRRRRAQELGLGVREVVTLASVVEKETGLENERPLIASVFWNRLKRRMPLQSDPTIIYDLKRRGVHPPSRSQARFPLQHLPAGGTAAGPDRFTRDGGHRRGAPSGRVGPSLLRVAQRRVASVLQYAAGAQRRRASVPDRPCPQGTPRQESAAVLICTPVRARYPPASIRIGERDRRAVQCSGTRRHSRFVGRRRLETSSVPSAGALW